MKRFLWLVGAGLLAISVWSEPVSVYQFQNPMQDDWKIAEPDGSVLMHELGTGFPPGELIESWTVGSTDFSPCPASELGPGVANVVVGMLNLTGKAWRDVYYVADWDLTFVSNFDELVGQWGTVPPWLSFKIDSLGENQPLISESLIVDNIWQAGETWEFVLQDYLNTVGGAAHLFGSWGLAAGSVADNDPATIISTGSIIVPEPSWGFLAMALAALGVGVARRRLG
jgi:hypothetical protein